MDTISGGNLQNNAVSARNYLYKVKQTTFHCNCFTPFIGDSAASIANILET